MSNISDDDYCVLRIIEKEQNKPRLRGMTPLLQHYIKNNYIEYKVVGYINNDEVFFVFITFKGLWMLYIYMHGYK